MGISFGVDRIYDVIEELGLFPEALESGCKAMVVNFGGENETYALQVVQQLRNAGIATELYPDAVKFDKQMKYAHKRNIPFVLLLGDEERAQQLISIKDFRTGTQQKLPLAEVIQHLSNE